MDGWLTDLGKKLIYPLYLLKKAGINMKKKSVDANNSYE